MTVLDVLPGDVASQPRNLRLINSETSSKIPLQDIPLRIQIPNFLDFRSGQLGSAEPQLLIPINHVVLMGSDKQMMRSNAVADITPMQNVECVSKVPDEMPVRESMHLLGSSVDRKTAVSQFVACSHKQPTAGLHHEDFIQESVSNRRSDQVIFHMPIITIPKAHMA
jgi:hypothetical protein